MSRREDREAVNKGCNCLIILVIVIALIASGVRALINGDIKLPNFGSSHVTGGSGTYGTSNGANIQYENSTNPNSNSSLNDYTHTNSLPTEYRTGGNITNHSSQNETRHSMDHGSSITSTTSNTSTINNIGGNNSYNGQKEITCPRCNGKGYIKKSWIFTGEKCNYCAYCGREGRHEHNDESEQCFKCYGSGKITVESR